LLGPTEVCRCGTTQEWNIQISLYQLNPREDIAAKFLVDPDCLLTHHRTVWIIIELIEASDLCGLEGLISDEFTLYILESGDAHGGAGVRSLGQSQGPKIDN
jgi:hypothetical protein